MEMSGRPKYKILIVEDDADLSKALGMMLNFDGHQVHIVDRGDAALAMLATSKFDLLITDYLMPEMNGDQLAALVKHRWPDQPIILATEAVETLDYARSHAIGVDCVLNKPFTLQELREAVIWVLALYADNPQHDLGNRGLLGSPPAKADTHSRASKPRKRL